MNSTLGIIVISAGLFLAFTMPPAVTPASGDNTIATTSPDLVTASGNNCPNGQIMDDSTAEQTRQRVEAVGYVDVKVLEKGCDNFWRVTGVKGGESRNLVVSPDGGVMPGGN